MITATLALARAGFIEARRNRVTVIVGAFALLLILMTTVVLNTTVFTLERVVTDFGLGVMSVLMVALTLFLSVGMLSREIERKTLFLVVSRPISRASFVLGRYLGVVLTLTLIWLIMGALYLSQVLLFEVPITSSMVASMLGVWVETLLLAALGLMFSSFSGQIVATVCMVGLYFIGHSAPDLYDLASRTPPALSAVVRAVYYLTPNLDRLDFRPQAAAQAPIDVGQALVSGGYSLAWTVLFLVAASAIFSRRDFK